MHLQIVRDAFVSFIIQNFVVFFYKGTLNKALNTRVQGSVHGSVLSHQLETFFWDIFSFFAHTLTHVFFWYYSHIQKSSPVRETHQTLLHGKHMMRRLLPQPPIGGSPRCSGSTFFNFRYIITHGRNDHHHDAGGMNIEHHHFDEGLRCQSQSPCLSLF